MLDVLTALTNSSFGIIVCSVVMVRHALSIA